MKNGPINYMVAQNSLPNIKFIRILSVKSRYPARIFSSPESAVMMAHLLKQKVASSLNKATLNIDIVDNTCDSFLFHQFEDKAHGTVTINTYNFIITLYVQLFSPEHFWKGFSL